MLRYRRMHDRQKPFVVNVADVPWEPFSHSMFGSDDPNLTAYVRANKLDVSLYCVAPGQRACSYDFHYAEAQLFPVLDGSGLARYGGEARRSAPQPSHPSSRDTWGPVRRRSGTEGG